jgi:hypothetical protein
MTMALIIIDFDNTITSQHTYHIIQQAISKERSVESDQEAQWALVKNIAAIQCVDGDTTLTWAELFAKIDAEGHSIGIASFNSYGPTIIPRYLKHVIGLSDELIAKIVIDSWLPSDSEQNSKNKHIFNIKNKFNYRNLMATIVMIDDDQNDDILSNAIDRGFSTVKAYDDGRHLKYLNDSVLPMFKSDSDQFAAFKTNQRGGPHGIDFSGDVIQMDFGMTQIDEGMQKIVDETESHAPAAYDVQFISASMNIRKVAENITNGLIISSDYKLFSVSNKSLLQFDVDQSAISNWLQEASYLKTMQSVTGQPLSMFLQLCSDSKHYQALMALCCNNLIPVKEEESVTLPSAVLVKETLFYASDNGCTHTLTEDNSIIVQNIF